MKLEFYTKRVLAVLLCAFTPLLASAQEASELWATTRTDHLIGQGTMFSSAADGTDLKVRHKFEYERPGRFVGDFVEFNGEFYATQVDLRTDDLSAGIGTLFKWNPVTNEYTTLHRFNGATGNQPSLYLYLKDNKLYGNTRLGGQNDHGVIYEFDPITNVYKKLVDLYSLLPAYSQGGGDSFTMYNGKFYGVILADMGSGGDYLYEWDPDTGTLGKTFRAAGSLMDNGTHEPFAKMAEYQGKLYAATNEGGEGGMGEIVEWDLATNTYIGKVSFRYPMGKPNSYVTWKDGKLYGITTRSELYEWDPATNALTIKMTIPSAISTYVDPIGFTLYNGKLYGRANGGSAGQGIIFEWDPDTNAFTSRFSFANGRSGRFQGQMIEWQGKLWGRRPVGVEAHNNTEMYSWDPATNAFEGKFIFNVSEGNGVKSGLTMVGSKLYGTAYGGGISDLGVIYRFDPRTEEFKILQSLDATKGSRPLGNLVHKNGKLYGTTWAGGLYGVGTLFELDIQTNTFTKKVDFVATNGRQPEGSLIEQDGKFYGMTTYGGYYDLGVIFEWDPVTNVYTKKLDFTAATGGRPTGDLLFRNGKFYGTTTTGSPTNGGSLFEWDPVSNTITKQQNLNSTTGMKPYGSFITYNNKLYTLTSAGGESNLGTVLEWELETNTTRTPLQVGSDLRGSMALSNGNFYFLARNPGTVVEWNPVTNAFQYPSTFGNYLDPLGYWPSVSTMTLIPAGALPVTLVDFNAKLQENQGMLTWRTTEESNFSHFELQRSHDARTFSTIGEVSTSPTGRYSFIDTGLNEITGTYAYYRLKMIDRAPAGGDGAFAYSAILRLALPGEGNLIYPNPVVETLHVKHTPKTNGAWQLADMKGNIVMGGKSDGEALELDMRSLRTGIYLLKFSNGHILKVLKN
ncbi:choice-of-anchor tandem repeat GloVer-containing protein [Dyadobacter sp. BHUBP1]|uniref:choice-of-anchor tandem repeat GloVer-containing protein n=1 Tax=Dyadobacter sp. BHUBP1 TaxID=3424178 RepID=UPI003D32A083